jgi:hypothetical protein
VSTLPLDYPINVINIHNVITLINVNIGHIANKKHGLICGPCFYFSSIWLLSSPRCIYLP